MDGSTTVARTGDLGSPPPSTAGVLARLLRVNSSSELDEVTVAMADAVSPLGALTVAWRVDPDRGRMRRLRPAPDRANAGRDEFVVGPVAEVVAAGHALDVAITDTNELRTWTGETSEEPHPSPTTASEVPVGRFAPVRIDAKVLAVIGVIRRPGDPPFNATERGLLDVAADRVALIFQAETAQDLAASSTASGISSAGGILLDESLMVRLSEIAGDTFFRHRFRTGTSFVTPGVHHTLGYEAAEFLSDPGLACRLIHPDDRHLLTDLVDHPQRTYDPLIIRTISRTGAVVHQLVRVVPLRNERGRVLGIEGLATDISSIKREEEQLVLRARSDSLTGLSNRLTFREDCARALARIARHGGQVAVLYLDLDGFKKVNDTLGHRAGDEVLIEVAARLSRITRRENVVARLGGDEFAILLVDVADTEEAVATAQRILRVLTDPIFVDSQQADVSTGVGVSITSDGTESADVLIHRADVALYEAKRSGRGRWHLGEAPAGTIGSGSADDGRVAATEGLLRASLAAGDFRVHYLPEYVVEDGSVAGFEALVRWQHPELGLLSAEQFVRDAEMAGILAPLGDWVLLEACRHLRRWEQRFGVAVAIRVNVSATQLASPGFAESVLHSLAAVGVRPRSVSLELSERELLDAPAPVERALVALRNGGLQLGIDGFGVGTSTLRSLGRVPVDRLKLDRSLIEAIDRVDGADDLLALSVKLAGSLGAETVAVGVERPAQLVRLREIGCQLYQGFLHGPPLTVEEIERQIENGTLRVLSARANPS